MEGEQNNEGPAPIFRPVEIDLHSSGDTGFLGWSSPNTVEHEVSTTDDRNSLENEVSRVSSPVGVHTDEGLIAFMRTMMNSLNEKMDKNNEELKKNNEELRKDLNEKMDKNNEELKKNNEELRKDLNEKMDKNNEGLRDLNYRIDQNNEELKSEIQRSNEQLKRDMEQMRGELNNKIVEITEVMRVEINKDLNTLNKELKNLEEGVRLEISEQAEKNKGERSKLKSQLSVYNLWPSFKKFVMSSSTTVATELSFVISTVPFPMYTQVYSSARPSALKMLNSIQKYALRLATEAFRSSPIPSLLAYAGEPPL
ncbi:hypothetical protein J6590_083257 [Homalodisca vitripennis]|nr:hypothetical protein J6590_083257 [Homalodisca vitripennis]